MNYQASFTSCTLLTLSLAACGGGSSGDSGNSDKSRLSASTYASKSIVITQDTYTQIASTAFNSILSNYFTYSDSVSGVVIHNKDLLDKAKQQALNDAKRLTNQADFVSGITYSQREFTCDEKGMLIVTGVYSGRSEYTAGDDVLLEYKNCDYGDGYVLNGKLSYIVNEADYFAGIDISYDYVNYKISTPEGFTQLHGDERNVVHNSSMVLEINELEINYNNEYSSVTFNQDLDYLELSSGKRISSSADFVDSELKAKISYSTLSEFVFNAYDEPQAGVLLIEGAQSSQMRITFDSHAMAIVELDSDGNGSFESIESVYWSDLGVSF